MKNISLLALAMTLAACADTDSEKEGADSGQTASTTTDDNGGTGDDGGTAGGDDGGTAGGDDGGTTGGDDGEAGNADNGGTGDDGSTNICDNDYAFCGSIDIPADLAGTPRAMAISLYDTLDPLGPPNVTVMEIDAPQVVAGESYAVEFEPLIATGDYYVWIFLYMEGGGEWAPEPGIDYFGHSDAMISFTGDAVGFDPIPLSLAQ